MGAVADVAPNSEQLLEAAKRLFEEGRLHESEGAHQQLIRLGKMAEGHYGLGLIRFRERDYGTAAVHFERCLTAAPDHANAAYYLGQTWALRNASDIARAFYHMALTHEPGHAGALKQLQALPAPNRLAGERAAEDGPARLPVGPPNHVGPQGFYEVIRRDPGPIAQQVVRAIDSLKLSVRPALTAYLGTFFLRGFLIWFVAGPLLPLLFLTILAPRGGRGFDGQVWFASGVVLFILHLPVAYALLRIKTTRYALDQGCLQITRGVFRRSRRNIELYRVLDLELRQTLLNRLTHDGSLVLYVEGVHGLRNPGKFALRGIARGNQLHELFDQLRNLVALLRSGPWGKGIIY